MTYYVTKTIKGRPYLYLQWSWRAGGKVKTDNVYIAPLDPSTGTVDLPDDKTPKEVYAETREAFLNGLSIDAPEPKKAAIKTPPAPRKPPPETMPPIPDKFQPSEPRSKGGNKPDKKPARRVKSSDDDALTLHAAIHFDELKISPHSIEQRHLKHLRFLHAAGLDEHAAPAISMTHGIQHKVRFFPRQNVIAIRTPRRGKGVANGLRENFSRALALSKLHALQAQIPDVYEALTLHGKTLQKQTKTELRKYLLSTNGRRKRTKALAVKMFGSIEPIRKGRSGKVPAASLGLSDYGNRSDWHEDTALLLMEIEKHKDGFAGIHAETRKELGKAKGTLKRANGQGFSFKKLVLGERMSWGFARRREIRRAEARAALHQIRIERLNGLKDAFSL